MIMSIDLIQTQGTKRAATTWDFVSRHLAACPGFKRGQLVQTFAEMNVRESYPLASICRWDSAEDWRQARSATRKNPEVVSRLRASQSKFIGFTMSCVDGNEYDFSRKSSACVLLDVIYLNRARTKSYAAMWNRCNAFMSTQPGYINASLYQNQSLDDDVQFINIAEWDKPESLTSAAHTDEFGSIVAPFKDDFALYLTNRIALRNVDIPEEALV